MISFSSSLYVCLSRLFVVFGQEEDAGAVVVKRTVSRASSLSLSAGASGVAGAAALTTVCFCVLTIIGF